MTNYIRMKAAAVALGKSRVTVSAWCRALCMPRIPGGPYLITETGLERLRAYGASLRVGNPGKNAGRRRTA